MEQSQINITGLRVVGEVIGAGIAWAGFWIGLGIAIAAFFSSGLVYNFLGV